MTSNCSGPTAASTGAASPRRSDRRTCTTPSCSSCSMPLRNCLYRPVSVTRGTAKCSGAKLGIGGKMHRYVDGRGCRRPQRRRVRQADDIAGIGVVDRRCGAGRTSAGRTWWRTARRCARGSATMPRSNLPEHTRAKAIRSRCAGSMPACTLKTNPQNGASTGRAGRRRRPGVGGGRELDQRVQSCLTPKLSVPRR